MIDENEAIKIIVKKLFYCGDGKSEDSIDIDCLRCEFLEVK